MVKISRVYLYNEKIISVLNDVNLHQQAYSKYFICIELKSIESDDTYGGIAYQLIGRPFIMSADEIMKYKKLLDANAITQEEYDKKKAELLNK